MILRKNFYFIRHGQTDWNKEKRCMGQQDIPLNAQGQKEAELLQSLLEKIQPKTVYHSPLLRAKQTMEIALANMLEAPHIIEEKNMIARHFGEWEGQSWQKLYIENFQYFYPPGGEQHEQCIHRITQGINSILQQSETTPLIISHSGIFLTLCDLLNIENASIKNCEVKEFIPTDKSEWHCRIVE